MDVFIILVDGRILESEKVFSINFDEDYVYILCPEKLLRVRLDDIHTFDVL